MVTENKALEVERNVGNFFYPETHTHDAGVGLSERTIHYISDVKQDPDWVREFRLSALRTFLGKPMLDAKEINHVRFRQDFINPV